MKMVMQVWTAKPEEVQRVPALQEFKNYTASANFATNPAEMLKQVLGGLPGMGDSMGAMIEEISKKGAMSLRMHTEVFMPLLAMMSQQLPQQPGQPLPPALDPNAPLHADQSGSRRAFERSAVDDSLFRVPAGLSIRSAGRHSESRGFSGCAAAPAPGLAHLAFAA